MLPCPATEIIQCPPRRIPFEDERSPAVIHRGVTIHEDEPLPDLPLPKTVVVSPGHLHIDDTAVCFWVISKNTIDWLGSQIPATYRKEDRALPEKVLNLLNRVACYSTAADLNPAIGAGINGSKASMVASIVWSSLTRSSRNLTVPR